MLYEADVHTVVSSTGFSGEIGLDKTGNGFRVFEIEYTAHHSKPSHSHENPYFCMLLQGEYTEHVESSVHHYTEHSIAFHPPQILHRDEFGAHGGRILIIELLAPLHSLVKDLGMYFESAIAPQKDRLAWFANRLYLESREPDHYSPLAMEGLVMGMISTLIRKKSARQRTFPQWMQLVEDHLRQQFASEISLPELAKVAGVHPVYLSRTFRKFHGRTVSEYLNELRVQFATRELMKGTATLDHIAVSAGFCDQSHFNRVFKRFTGSTPGAYRAAHATHRLV